MFKATPTILSIRKTIARLKRETEASADRDIPGARPVCEHGIVVTDLRRGCCFCRGAITRRR